MATVCTNDCPQVKIQQLQHGNTNVTEFETSALNIGTAKTMESGADYHIPGTKAGVTLIIVNPEKVRKCKNGCRAVLTSNFAIPEVWWKDCCKRANGYFGFEELPDADDKKIGGAKSWAFFQVKSFGQPTPQTTQVPTEPDASPGEKKPEDEYEWNKLNTFSRWYKDTNHTVILLFTQKKDKLRSEFQSCLLDPPPTQGELQDPFWIYPRLANEIIQLENASVWRTRDMIRDVEKAREKAEKQFEAANPNYSHLHKIARHVVHVSETLKVGAVTLDSMRSHQEEFLRILGQEAGEKEPTAPIASRKIRSGLAFAHHMLVSYLHRSEANTARIQSETTLAFNKVSQEDSNISVQIADHTRTDSKAMRTIALVTMLFLPATFVSAIFSMSFFNSEGGVWKVSDKFWIYWVVAFLVTVATFAGWYFGEPYFAPKKINPAVRHQLSRREEHELAKQEKKEQKKKGKGENTPQMETQLVAPKANGHELRDMSQNGVVRRPTAGEMV